MSHPLLLLLLYVLPHQTRLLLHMHSMRRAWQQLGTTRGISALPSPAHAIQSLCLQSGHAEASSSSNMPLSLGEHRRHNQGTV
jgi:hypothetical protein